MGRGPNPAEVDSFMRRGDPSRCIVDLILGFQPYTQLGSGSVI